jgi:cytochrome P450
VSIEPSETDPRIAPRVSAGLDRALLHQFFDLRSSYNVMMGGGYADDPYPVWSELRSSGPVHEGIVHELTGFDGPAMFQGLPFPDRRHFSAFSYSACDAAFRNERLFASSHEPIDPNADEGLQTSMLYMGGVQHRRYRTLVQPSFVPVRAKWWIERWIESTVHSLIDGFVEDGQAELNVDFCAAIPVLTITGSFGVPIDQALAVRAALRPGAPNGENSLVAILAPIVAARRNATEDDLISVLVSSEMTDEDGTVHRLSDAEIYSFAALLLAAGSGTTWKQMGIVLSALLSRPAVLDVIREDRSLVPVAIEESLRWSPTDPMFSRFVTEDTEFFGTKLTAGSVLHLCLGAANRDPERWDDPDTYDVQRPSRPSLGFGSGPHICLGMHVARAEMSVALNALLDRLPNLRLDPAASLPRMIGMYERGVTEIPVVWN